jgi:histidine triad (HIT) family protein
MNKLAEKDCPFCKMVRHELNHVLVQEDKDILVIMDLYPATTGHMLVLPKQHIETIYDMPAALGVRIMTTAITLAKAIKLKLSPDGLNLIQSNEIAAGQTVPHFHLHIVPRYRNDSIVLNFGHGNVPEKIADLEQTASSLRSVLLNK